MSTTITAAPSTHEIVLTHDFDAPRELVFKVFNDPELVSRWWGPRRLTTEVVKWDVRPGGSWRTVQRDPEGHEFGFRGVYHDVVAPEWVVRTFEFEGEPGHVSLETAVLEDHGARTRLTMTSVFQSVADRDAMVQAGMESGARESMERIEELLAELKRR
jgi:uncharacterized protein YndB with AHSA1/START domain